MIDTINFFITREDCFRHKLDRRAVTIAKGLRETDDRYRSLQVSFTEHGDLIISISVPGLLWGDSLGAEYFPHHREWLENELEDMLTTLGVVIPVSLLRLCRVDICRNLHLARPASVLICQAARYPAPKAAPLLSRDESTIFIWGKHRSLKLYDKKRQCLRRRGGNVLRIELRLAKGKLIRQYLGGEGTLGELLDLPRQRILRVLHHHLCRIIGTTPPPYAPDAEAVWKQAQTQARRGTAAVFLAIFQAERNQLAPVDVVEINSLLKSRLSTDAFYKARNQLLRPIATGSMDMIFRAEVLDRILEESEAVSERRKTEAS